MDFLPLVLDLGILTVAVVLHEVGHGGVAYACGDPRAAGRGRLALNPLRHRAPPVVTWPWSPPPVHSSTSRWRASPWSRFGRGSRLRAWRARSCARPPAS